MFSAASNVASSPLTNKPEIPKVRYIIGRRNCSIPRIRVIVSRWHKTDLPAPAGDVRLTGKADMAVFIHNSHRRSISKLGCSWGAL
jgi:hypothetical protein